MEKEIILYDSISRWSADEIVQKFIDAGNDTDVLLRLNSGGGATDSGNAIVSKIIERKGKTNIIVDGLAASYAAIMLLFADNVVLTEASRIMFHKAAYPEEYIPTEDEQKQLDNINNLFKDKLSKKIADNPKGEKFIEKVFDETQRNDVWLTPKEALNLGIVSEIRKFDPRAEEIRAEISASITKIVNKANEPIINNSKTSKMTKEELKAQQPELYNTILAEGSELGVKNERSRVAAFSQFIEADEKAVLAHIQNGTAFDNAIMAELNVKLVSKIQAKAMASDAPAAVTTTEPVATTEKTEKEKEVEAYGKALKDNAKKFNPFN